MQIDDAGYVCVRCAGCGSTCCRLGGSVGEDCFPLSAPELGRIEAAVAASADAPGGAPLVKVAQHAVDACSGQPGLCTREANSKDFVAAMRNLFPTEKDRLEKLFPPGQEHNRLALSVGGACIFLAPGGCLLPKESRPWFCKLFPFWVLNGSLQCFADEQCLALKENSGFRRLLEAFGTNQDEVMGLYQHLRRDWGLE